MLALLPYRHGSDIKTVSKALRYHSSRILWLKGTLVIDRKKLERVSLCCASTRPPSRRTSCCRLRVRNDLTLRACLILSRFRSKTLLSRWPVDRESSTFQGLRRLPPVCVR